MNKLIKTIVFLNLVFLISNSVKSQLAFFLEVRTELPTPGFSDGKIVPHLQGYYPNPIRYEIFTAAGNYVTLDSVIGLPEAAFNTMANAIQIFVIDTVTNIDIATSTLFYFSNPVASFEVSCDSIFGSFNSSDCEGEIQANSNFGFTTDAITVEWRENYLPAMNTDVLGTWSSLMQTNLCDGMYSVLSSNPFGWMTQFYVGSIIDNTPLFTAEIFTTPSSPDSCTATALADLNGAAGPFTYSWDGVPVTQNMASQLCPGLYTVYITDGNMDSLAALYGIVDSTDYYYDPLIMYPADDTIFFMVENCIIDYDQPIDSIFITNYNFYTTTAVFTFQVWQNGVAITFSSSAPYEVPEESDFLIDLTIYCLTKDISSDLIKYQGFSGNVAEIASKDIMEGRSVHPNPSDGIIYVETKDAEQIEIYTLQGSLILRTSKKSIDLSDYPAGIYQVIVKNDKGVIVGREKLILQ